MPPHCRAAAARRTRRAHADANGVSARVVFAADRSNANHLAESRAILRRRGAGDAADPRGLCARAAGGEARRLGGVRVAWLRDGADRPAQRRRAGDRRRARAPGRAGRRSAAHRRATFLRRADGGGDGARAGPLATDGEARVAAGEGLAVPGASVLTLRKKGGAPRLTFVLATVTFLGACEREGAPAGIVAADPAFCSQVHITGAKLSEHLAPLVPLMRTSTGVYSLEEGDVSLVLRAWLAEAAERTIDVQYFIFTADNVGLIAVDYLLRAADRGVHVRLLVDDFMLEVGGEDLLRSGSMPNPWSWTTTSQSSGPSTWTRGARTSTPSASRSFVTRESRKSCDMPWTSIRNPTMPGTQRPISIPTAPLALESASRSGSGGWCRKRCCN